ncbi:MAG: DUF29 domain-containing protein [Burkholderiales bacterium]
MGTLDLYEKDFYAWTVEQAKLIKAKAFDKLDYNHLLEEVESMGASERNELVSRLETLIGHLLKWQYQPTHRGNSWEYTIIEQRDKIKDHINENPSLRSYLEAAFEKGYKYGVLLAAKETKLSRKAFPTTCKWTIEQALNDEFYPD